MIRLFSPVGLVACSLCIAFCNPVSAQPVSPASEMRESGVVSTLRDSNDIVGELINAAAEAELELSRCSLTSAPSGGEARAELSVMAPGISDVKRLLAGLRLKRPVLVEKLAMKPSISSAVSSGTALFELELRLDPQDEENIGNDALARLAPFEALPVFSLARPAIDEVRLYSCSIDAKGARAVQLVAPRLGDLSETVRKGADSMPAMSKAISRTTIGSSQVFTLDLSDDPAFGTAADLLVLFERLAKAGDLREITLQMAPDGSKLHKMVMHLSPEQTAQVGTLLVQENRQVVLKADVIPRAAPVWAVTLLAGAPSSTGATQAERSVAPLADLVALLSAPWPVSRRDGLQFSWTPGSIQMNAVITDERDVDALKPVTTALGLTYQGAKRRESLETGVLTVGFGRELAGGGPGVNVSMDAPLSRFLGFAELLEDGAVQDGRRIVVACEFGEESRLLEGIQQDIGKRTRSISIECLPGTRCKTTLILASQDHPESAAILGNARALVSAALPWNRPESDLGNSLIVTGLKVDSPDRFAVTGLTLKSRLIFSDLFPALEKIPGVIDPFFEKGSYSDHKAGRLMRFEVTARRAAR